MHFKYPLESCKHILKIYFYCDKSHTLNLFNHFKVWFSSVKYIPIAYSADLWNYFLFPKARNSARETLIPFPPSS